MSTLYTASSTQWPVLQSSTEVKHKSGLLSASAQFICPANNIVMPTSIPSSGGPITNIYPPPSVSIQGEFATINATGYKQWSNADTAEIIKNIVLIDLNAVAFIHFYGNETIVPQKIKISGEAATVRKVVTAGLPEIPTLNLFGKQTWNVQDIFFGVSPNFYTGNFSNVSPTLTTQITSLRSNNFGTLVEIEATYELKAFINFGSYTTETPPQISEIPE